MTNDVEINTAHKKWTIPVNDAGDGSGDGIIIFPDDLLTLAGWTEGDTLTIEIINNSIKLSKVNDV